MNRPIVNRLLLLPASLVAGTMLLAGCSSNGGSASQPDAPTTSTSSPTEAGTMIEADDSPNLVAFEEPDADDFDKLLASDETLDALQAATILGVETVDPTRLVVSFEMESHHCYGPRTRVEESDAEIVVELMTGRRVGVDPGSCTYGVYPYTTAVELGAPIGDRTITAAEAREPQRTDSTDEQAADSGDDPAANLVGGFVEDGVEWAIEHDIAWRVLSYEGVPVDDDGPSDPDRISFVVLKDRVVSYEWS